MNSNQNQIRCQPSGSNSDTISNDEEECSSTCNCDEKSENEVQNGVIDTVWKVGCYKINPTTQSGIQDLIICNIHLISFLALY